MTEDPRGSRPVDPLQPESLPPESLRADPLQPDPLQPDPLQPDPLQPAAEPSGQESTKDAAKEQASQVKDEAVAGGAHVAGVAKSEARNVTAEAGQQAKHLWQQTRSEVMDQAEHQQRRIAEGLRDLGSQFGSMAENADANGIAADLVRQGSTKAHAIAQWLEARDPGMVMEEVRSFGRRKPGVFLAAAAALGFAAARMGRGLQADHQDESSTGQGGAATEADLYPVPGSTGTMSAGEQLP